MLKPLSSSLAPTTDLQIIESFQHSEEWRIFSISINFVFHISIAVQFIPADPI